MSNTETNCTASSFATLTLGRMPSMCIEGATHQVIASLVDGVLVLTDAATGADVTYHCNVAQNRESHLGYPRSWTAEHEALVVACEAHFTLTPASVTGR